MNNSPKRWITHQPNRTRYCSAVIRFGRLILLGACTYFYSLMLFAQTSDYPGSKELSQQSSATTDIESTNVNPTRIIESHEQNGDRSVSKKSIQVRGFDGHFEPYYDVETEAVQPDSTTVRTIKRTFGRDGSGTKTLLQISEEEKHTLPSGESNVIRITSSPDTNGRLQQVERETVETKNIGAGIEEMKSTVMRPSITGGLAPVLKTQEIRKSLPNGSIEAEKVTLIPDGGGKWQVTEARQTTTRQEGDARRTEERVSRLDFDGKLAEISRVVTTDSAVDSSERRTTTETYSIDVPGVTRDGKLHLVERATSTQHSGSNGEPAAEAKVEQLNPGDPTSGLRISTTTTGTLRPGPSGKTATRTMRARNADGSFGIVSIQTTNSDKSDADQAQRTSSEELH